MLSLCRHVGACVLDSSKVAVTRSFELRPLPKRARPPPDVHPFAPRFFLRRSERPKVDQTSQIFLGTVVGTKMRNVAKVRVESLTLKTKVLKYYLKRQTYYARDLHNRCVLGDVVLIRERTNKRQQLAPRHIVVELVEPAPQGQNPAHEEPSAYSRILKPAYHTFSPIQPLEDPTTLSEARR